MFTGFTVKLQIVPRSTNRMTIDIRTGNLEIFFSRNALDNFSKIAKDFLDIKFLDPIWITKLIEMSQSAVNKGPRSGLNFRGSTSQGFKKEALNSSKTKSSLAYPFMQLRKKLSGMSRSRIKSSTRKNSGETNYLTVMSDDLEDDDKNSDDEYEEVFIDESELLCYNELQKTSEMIEGAGTVFTNNLEVIEEIEDNRIYRGNRKQV